MNRFGNDYQRHLGFARGVTLLGAIVVAVASGSNYAYSGIISSFPSAFFSFFPNLLFDSNSLCSPIWDASKSHPDATQYPWYIVFHDCPSLAKDDYQACQETAGRTLQVLLWEDLSIRVDRGCKAFGFAFLSLLLGYSGIRLFYEQGAGSYSTISLQFGAIVSCFFLTGAGSNAGASASMNTTAKSVPPALYSTMTGLVMSGYGISAFFFSAISSVLFPGSPSALLLFLSLGTSVPMIIGLCFVKPVPLTESIISEQQPLIEGSSDPDVVVSAGTYASFENSSSNKDLTPDIRGIALLRTLQFWLFVIVLICLTGSGLMYINNVGSMVRALYEKHSQGRSDQESARLQVLQVSYISLFNCLGRVALGVSSDAIRMYLHLPRSLGLMATAIILLVSQLKAIHATSPEQLWLSSAFMGLGYGGIFGLWAGLLIEWFGIAHYSENSALANLSPVIGGNFFNLAFGLIFDSRSVVPEDATGIRCLIGVKCYAVALQLSIVACILSITLSCIIVRRDMTRMRSELAVI